MPCTSNYYEDSSADAVVKYCKEHIDPSRLKGFYTAPWTRMLPADAPDVKGVSCTLSGLDLFAAARGRYYLQVTVAALAIIGRRSSVFVKNIAFACYVFVKNVEICDCFLPQHYDILRNRKVVTA